MTLLYQQMLGTGLDYRETSNSLCTGKDCAVGDDHEVFFPLDEFEDDESNDSSKNETTPSSNPSSGKQPAKIFIGVYNSRAVAQPGWLGGTLSRHESLRFQSPLEYVLTATAGSKATPVCFQNCSGRGSCCVSQIPTLFGPITLTVYSYTLRKTDTFLFYNQAKLWQKQSLPAARDAREFSKLGAGENMEEIQNRCGAFANTGSPHHLCLHLCYYVSQTHFRSHETMHDLACRHLPA